jgi:hypothetical protein
MSRLRRVKARRSETELRYTYLLHSLARERPDAREVNRHASFALTIALKPLKADSGPARVDSGEELLGRITELLQTFGPVQVCKTSIPGSSPGGPQFSSGTPAPRLAHCAPLALRSSLRSVRGGNLQASFLSGCFVSGEPRSTASIARRCDASTTRV